MLSCKFCGRDKFSSLESTIIIQRLYEALNNLGGSILTIQSCLTQTYTDVIQFDQHNLIFSEPVIATLPVDLVK